MRRAVKMLLIALPVLAVLLAGWMFYSSCQMVGDPGMVADWSSRIRGEWVSTGEFYEGYRCVIDGGALQFYIGDECCCMATMS